MTKIGEKEFLKAWELFQKTRQKPKDVLYNFGAGFLLGWKAGCKLKNKVRAKKQAPCGWCVDNGRAYPDAKYCLDCGKQLRT